MSRELRNERGIALLLSMVGLVVVGAMVTGVFASGILEHRVGDNTRRVEQAFSAAEQGLSETIATWQPTTFNTVPVGGTVPIAGTTPGGSGSYAGRVVRTGAEMFMVDVVGRDAVSGARQRLGAFVKLVPINIDIQAALTTRGQAKIGGSVSISGVDEQSWTGCPLPGDTESGIRTPDASQLDFVGGCSGASCVVGDPPVEEDPTVDDDTFFDYGELDWDDLVAMSNKVLTGTNYTGMQPSTTAGGQCDFADILNWGEPWEPPAVPECFNYFPIIYAPGDLSVQTGRGQGILLVEGDLNANGNFEFYGPVIVKGRLKTAGTGNHFEGGVLAANADLDDSSVLGNAVVTFSRCAIARATQGSAPGSMLRARGWTQVY